jgi:CheY-like chemotaxis protein
MTDDVPAWSAAADALRAVGPLARDRKVALVHDAHAALEATIAAERDGLTELLTMVLSNAVLDAEPGAQIGLVATPGAPQWLRFEVQGAGRLGPARAVDRLASRLGVGVDGGPPPAVEVALTAPEPRSARFLPGGACAEGAVRAVVLCIDDQLANAGAVLGALRDRPGVEAVFAHDATSGIQLAQQRRPDFILLDVDVPGLAGSAVLAALRADRRTAELPVVVLGANGAEDLLRAGAQAFLRKPVEAGELLAAMDRLLARG